MQTLWIGEPFKIEQLCLKSFIDNGHIVHLYVYDKVENIPEGVTVMKFYKSEFLRMVSITFQLFRFSCY